RHRSRLQRLEIAVKDQQKAIGDIRAAEKAETNADRKKVLADTISALEEEIKGDEKDEGVQKEDVARDEAAADWHRERARALGLPGSVLTIASGFVFGLLGGTLIVVPASVIGASAAFLLGRTAARDFLAERVARDPRLRAIDEAVGRSGFKIVLLLRLSPVLP